MPARQGQTMSSLCSIAVVTRIEGAESKTRTFNTAHAHACCLHRRLSSTLGITFRRDHAVHSYARNTSRETERWRFERKLVRYVLVRSFARIIRFPFPIWAVICSASYHHATGALPRRHLRPHRLIASAIDHRSFLFAGIRHSADGSAGTTGY